MKKDKRNMIRIAAASMGVLTILAVSAGRGYADQPEFEAEATAEIEAEVKQVSGIKPVQINAANFPDDRFRAVISGPKYDRDGNGTLDAEEIGLTINIECEGEGIHSLKGVEYFTDLQGLWCKDNQIESMDISALKDLRGLWCSGNPLTELDLSPNPELVWVYCFDCKLKKLDVSKNTKMAFIECNTNPLKSLDVSQNPELEHLTCATCQLKSLDVTHNPKLAHLDAMRNELKSLDVTKNPKMKRLDIWDNPGLGSIDISKNPGLQYYNCANNDVVNIDVSHNPELYKLICSYNDIKNLDLSNNPKLVYLDCACNQISKLDISKNHYLYFLQAFTNPFKKLNIGDNPFLVNVYKNGTKKSEYQVCKGHSWTIDYGGDNSTSGDQIQFLCFDDVVALSTKATGTFSMKTIENVDSDVADGKNLVTREMVVETLYAMDGKPGVAGLKTRFTDVKKGDRCYDALLWGEKYSICMGYPYVSSDTFGVGNYIRRQDMAFMLMRYAEKNHYIRGIDFGRIDDFKDYFEVDYYAWEAMTWAIQWGAMEGKGEPGAPKEELLLDPHGCVTRAEAEKMIKNMLEANGEKISKIPMPDKPMKRKGSGTLSADGSILTDSDGKKYYIAGKITEDRLEKNTLVADKSSGGKYKITKVNREGGKVTGGTATYVKPYDPACKSATIKATVKIGGVSFKVTAIGKKAFKGCSALTKVTIGKNVKTIGAGAFQGCKKLKRITIKTTKLTKKTVGKNAFKGIHKKAVAKCPKKKRKAYLKILKERGMKG
ncbi:MAG: leucine-rich repeat protein [Lachnospiraceae bacterium]|nr:leucine-rich repeat protein [Lachnospiraceae bacterium]